MRVCMRVCMEIGIRTHDHHTTGTQDTRGREETTGKGRNTGKTKFVITGGSKRQK